MEIVVAVMLAVMAGFCLHYATYLQKKVVGKLPTVKFKIPWSTLKAFVTNVPWITAIGVWMIGGVFCAIALLLAPISIVQPIVASGVVLPAYLAIKNLGEKPRKIDIYAIGVTILGVILIGVSLAEGIPPEGEYDPVMLWALAGVVVFLAAVIPFVMHKSHKSEDQLAAGLGVSFGLLFGISAIFGRLLMLDWSNRFADSGVTVVFLSVFLPAWALTVIPAVIIQQASLQRGMAVVVAPLAAGLSQLVPILGGMIALNEPFPESATLTAARILAFILILGATVVLSNRTGKRRWPQWHPLHRSASGGHA